MNPADRITTNLSIKVEPIDCTNFADHSQWLDTDGNTIAEEDRFQELNEGSTEYPSSDSSHSETEQEEEIKILNTFSLSKNPEQAITSRRHRPLKRKLPQYESPVAKKFVKFDQVDNFCFTSFKCEDSMECYDTALRSVEDSDKFWSTYRLLSSYKAQVKNGIQPLLEPGMQNIRNGFRGIPSKAEKVDRMFEKILQNNTPHSHTSQVMERDHEKSSCVTSVLPPPHLNVESLVKQEPSSSNEYTIDCNTDPIPEDEYYDTDSSAPTSPAMNNISIYQNQNTNGNENGSNDNHNFASNKKDSSVFSSKELDDLLEKESGNKDNSTLFRVETVEPSQKGLRYETPVTQSSYIKTLNCALQDASVTCSSKDKCWMTDREGLSGCSRTRPFIPKKLRFLSDVTERMARYAVSAFKTFETIKARKSISGSKKRRWISLPLWYKSRCLTRKSLEDEQRRIERRSLNSQKFISPTESSLPTEIPQKSNTQKNREKTQETEQNVTNSSNETSPIVKSKISTQILRDVPLEKVECRSEESPKVESNSSSDNGELSIPVPSSKSATCARGRHYLVTKKHNYKCPCGNHHLWSCFTDKNIKPSEKDETVSSKESIDNVSQKAKPKSDPFKNLESLGELYVVIPSNSVQLNDENQNINQRVDEHLLGTSEAVFRRQETCIFRMLFHNSSCLLDKLILQELLREKNCSEPLERFATRRIGDKMLNLMIITKNISKDRLLLNDKVWEAIGKSPCTLYTVYVNIVESAESLESAALSYLQMRYLDNISQSIIKTRKKMTEEEFKQIHWLVMTEPDILRVAMDQNNDYLNFVNLRKISVPQSCKFDDNKSKRSPKSKKTTAPLQKCKEISLSSSKLLPIAKNVITDHNSRQENAAPVRVIGFLSSNSCPKLWRFLPLCNSSSPGSTGNEMKIMIPTAPGLPLPGKITEPSNVPSNSKVFVVGKEKLAGLQKASLGKELRRLSNVTTAIEKIQEKSDVNENCSFPPRQVYLRTSKDGLPCFLPVKSASDIPSVSPDPKLTRSVNLTEEQKNASKQLVGKFPAYYRPLQPKLQSPPDPFRHLANDHLYSPQQLNCRIITTSASTDQFPKQTLCCSTVNDATSNALNSVTSTIQCKKGENLSALCLGKSHASKKQVNPDVLTGLQNNSPVSTVFSQSNILPKDLLYATSSTIPNHQSISQNASKNLLSNSPNPFLTTRLVSSTPSMVVHTLTTSSVDCNMGSEIANNVFPAKPPYHTVASSRDSSANLHCSTHIVQKCLTKPMSNCAELAKVHESRGLNNSILCKSDSNGNHVEKNEPLNNATNEMLHGQSKDIKEGRNEIATKKTSEEMTNSESKKHQSDHQNKSGTLSTVANEMLHGQSRDIEIRTKNGIPSLNAVQQIENSQSNQPKIYQCENNKNCEKSLQSGKPKDAILKNRKCFIVSSVTLPCVEPGFISTSLVSKSAVQEGCSMESKTSEGNDNTPILALDESAISEREEMIDKRRKLSHRESGYKTTNVSGKRKLYKPFDIHLVTGKFPLCGQKVTSAGSKIRNRSKQPRLRIRLTTKTASRLLQMNADKPCARLPLIALNRTSHHGRDFLRALQHAFRGSNPAVKLKMSKSTSGELLKKFGQNNALVANRLGLAGKRVLNAVNNCVLMEVAAQSHDQKQRPPIDHNSPSDSTDDGCSSISFKMDEVRNDFKNKRKQQDETKLDSSTSDERSTSDEKMSDCEIRAVANPAKVLRRTERMMSASMNHEIRQQMQATPPRASDTSTSDVSVKRSILNKGWRNIFDDILFSNEGDGADEAKPMAESSLSGSKRKKKEEITQEKSNYIFGNEGASALEAKPVVKSTDLSGSEHKKKDEVVVTHEKCLKLDPGKVCDHVAATRLPDVGDKLSKDVIKNDREVKAGLNLDKLSGETVSPNPCNMQMDCSSIKNAPTRHLIDDTNKEKCTKIAACAQVCKHSDNIPGQIRASCATDCEAVDSKSDISSEKVGCLPSTQSISSFVRIEPREDNYEGPTSLAEFSMDVKSIPRVGKNVFSLASLAINESPVDYLAPLNIVPNDGESPEIDQQKREEIVVEKSECSGTSNIKTQESSSSAGPMDCLAPLNLVSNDGESPEIDQQKHEEIMVEKSECSGTSNIKTQESRSTVERNNVISSVKIKIQNQSSSSEVFSDEDVDIIGVDDSPQRAALKQDCGLKRRLLSKIERGEHTNSERIRRQEMRVHFSKLRGALGLIKMNPSKQLILNKAIEECRRLKAKEIRLNTEKNQLLKKKEDLLEKIESRKLKQTEVRLLEKKRELLQRKSALSATTERISLQHAQFLLLQKQRELLKKKLVLSQMRQLM